MVSGTSAEDPGLQHHFTIDSPARISPVGPLAIHLQIYETRTKRLVPREKARSLGAQSNAWDVRRERAGDYPIARIGTTFSCNPPVTCTSPAASTNTLISLRTPNSAW